MICPKCKKEIKESSKVCGYCGTKVAKAKPMTLNMPVVPEVKPLPPESMTAAPKTEPAPVYVPETVYAPETQQATCRYCGSTSLQAMKKGVSAGKLLAGAIIAGPVGMAVGAAGMNDTKIVCLNCGRDQ